MPPTTYRSQGRNDSAADLGSVRKLGQSCAPAVLHVESGDGFRAVRRGSAARCGSEEGIDPAQRQLPIKMNGAQTVGWSSSGRGADSISRFWACCSALALVSLGSSRRAP